MGWWMLIPSAISAVSSALSSNKYANKARREAEARQAETNKYRPGILKALEKQVNDPYSPAVQANYQTSTSATQRDLANATANLAQNFGISGMGQSATAAAVIAKANRDAMDANRTAQTQRLVMSEQQRNQAINLLLQALGDPNQLQKTYQSLSDQYGADAMAQITSIVQAIGANAATGGAKKVGGEIATSYFEQNKNRNPNIINSIPVAPPSLSVGDYGKVIPENPYPSYRDAYDRTTPNIIPIISQPTVPVKLSPKR
jgi:hypothetical protein